MENQTHAALLLAPSPSANLHGQMSESDTASERTVTPRSSIDSCEMEEPPSPVARLHRARDSMSKILHNQKQSLPIARSPFLSRFIPKGKPKSKPILPMWRELDSFQDETVKVWFVSRNARRVTKQGTNLRKAIIQTNSKKAEAWVGENVQGEGLVCYVEKSGIADCATAESRLSLDRKSRPHPLQKYVVTAASEDDATLSLVLKASAQRQPSHGLEGTEAPSEDESTLHSSPRSHASDASEVDDHWQLSVVDSLDFLKL